MPCGIFGRNQTRTKSTESPRVEASGLGSVLSGTVDNVSGAASEAIDLWASVVLPEWIEHSTSPLPRGCSTTELRQQKRRNNPRTGANAAETATRAPGDASKGWLARGAARRIIEAMSRINKDSETKKSGSRSARLAGALRENLRRRKAQERAREESQATGTAQKPAPARRDDPVR
jgi:hypothetical protein